MPLLTEAPIKHSDVEITGWHITEPLHELENSFGIQAPPHSTKHESLLKQNLVKDHLILLKFGPGKTVTYAPSGKPNPIDNRYVSFTHSDNILYLAISRQPVGIDLQFYTDKLLRVAGKFVSGQEYEWIKKNRADENRLIHFLWSAKEAVFKIYGQNLAFKDIVSMPFVPETTGEVTFNVRNTDKKAVHYTFFDQFCFCLAL